MSERKTIHNPAQAAAIPERPPRLKRFVHGAIMLLGLLGLFTLATFPMAWEDQAIVGGALFALAWMVHRFSQSRTATLCLVAISIFTTVRYLWWRFAETFSYLSYNAGREHWADLLFVGLLLGAETYAFVILVLGYIQSIHPLERKPVPLPGNADEWPTVDVLIPTYNEPLSVIKPTVLAALNLDWPRDKMRVLVLDDGRRDEIRDFAARCGAEYVGRADNRFAKAGNLNNTLRQTDGDMVAIFDCDHVPTRSFLQMTVGSFLADQRLAMLQTPHHFYTPNPIERNLGIFRTVPDEGALFYGVIQKGNDFWNATSFAGSCAVLRRTALEEIGGIAVETVTEDAHTSLRMQKRGWNTAYIDIPQAAGLAAFALRDHVNQRIRWARGLTQILRIEKPLWSSELSWPQRLCYFNGSVHFLYALPRLIFLTAPLGFLIFEMSNFYGYVLAILAYALPHLFLSTIANSRLQGRYRNPYWNEIFETVLAPFILIPTTLALISPYKGIFNVTPKSLNRGVKRYDWLMASPFLFLAGLNLLGIGLGVQRILAGGEEIGTLLVNIAWACYSTTILGVVLAMAQEPEEYRSQTRIPVKLPVFAVTADGRRVEGRTFDLSYGGAGIESPDAVRLAEGEQTALVFSVFGQELRLPARIVRVDKWLLQVRFANLSLAQEEALTRVIFSRANAWVDWNDPYPRRYSTWRSVAQIFALSMTGFGRVIRAAFRRTPRPQPAPMIKVDTSNRQAAVPLLIIALAAGLLTASPLSGQQGAEPAPEGPRAKARFAEAHGFSEYGLKQPIVLQAAEAEGGFRFWSPLTKIVEEASLELEYQTSTGTPESRLLVVLNGAEVAALPLDPDSGARQGSINLPADLFVGDNQLLFVLERGCEPDCAGAETKGAEWARIERTSEIRLAGRRLPVALDLRLLPMPLLDLSVARASEIGIVTSAGASPEELEAAGIAASWLGVLSDHRGVRFSAHSEELAAGHAVVVAKSGSALAARLGLSQQTAPAIVLLENPVDPYGTVLALVGRDGDALKLAARALAAEDFPKDGAIAVLSSGGASEPSQPDKAPRWLDPSEPVLFTQFAQASDLRVLANSALDLYVRTPADLNYGSKRRLPLTLRYFVRDLPIGASATLTLLMNGEFVGARELTGEETALDAYREDMFPVPVEALYPNSTLRIAFQVHQPDESASAVYPALEIKGESELDLTGFRRFAALPRLDLFANSGFPFTRRADLAETAVALGEAPGTAALSLYFNLMGVFGAHTGTSATQVSVMRPEQARAARNKDILVIGEPGADVFRGWDSQLAVSLAQPDLELRAESGTAEWLRWLSWGRFGRQRDQLSRALRSAKKVDAVVEGGESISNGRALVAIAVSSEEAAIELIEDMRSSSGEGAVYGTLSFLSDGALHSFTTAPATFYVGEPTVRANIDFWLGRFLWAMPLLALGFAFGLARIVRVRLERLAALRLQATQ